MEGVGDLGFRSKGLKRMNVPGLASGVCLKFGQ
jgi:hypothetical protein